MPVTRSASLPFLYAFLLASIQPCSVATVFSCMYNLRCIPGGAIFLSLVYQIEQ
jgi:hypothetical protein